MIRGIPMTPVARWAHRLIARHERHHERARAVSLSPAPHEALKQKARRGAPFLGVAAGYVRIGRGRIEKDPNQRAHDASGAIAWAKNGCRRCCRRAWQSQPELAR